MLPVASAALNYARKSLANGDWQEKESETSTSYHNWALNWQIVTEEADIKLGVDHVDDYWREQETSQSTLVSYNGSYTRYQKDRHAR